MKFFTITCATCQTKLTVRSKTIIGQVHACPKCNCMIEVLAPQGWPKTPSAGDQLTATRSTHREGNLATTPKVGRQSVSPRGRLRKKGFIWNTILGVSVTLVGTLISWPLWHHARVVQSRAIPGNADRFTLQTLQSTKPGSLPSFIPTQLQKAPQRQPPPQNSQLLGTGNGRSSDNRRLGNNQIEGPREQHPRPESLTEKQPGDLALEPSPQSRSRGQNQLDRSERSRLVRVDRSTSPLQKPDVEARLADVLAEVNFPQVRLVDLINFLSAMTRVPITFDVAASHTVGVHPTQDITIHKQNTTIADLLSSTLAPLGLTYTIDKGQLRVTQEDSETCRTVRYRVDDLVGIPPATLEQFARELQKLVAPNSWDHPEAKCAVENPAMLIVNQTNQVHHQILVFCETLRRATGLPLRSQYQLERFPLLSPRMLAKKKLDQTITLTITEPMWLLRVLELWQKKTGLTLLADWQLLATIQLAPDTEISGAVVSQTVHDALSAFFEPLGLTWKAIDGDTLQIVTLLAASQDLQLAFYDVHQLIDPETEAQTLAADLRQVFDNPKWVAAGTPGVVHYHPGSKYLIVLQTQPLQDRVEAWLRNLRLTKKNHL